MRLESIRRIGPRGRRGRGLLLGVLVIPLLLVVYANAVPIERPADRMRTPGSVVLDRHGVVLQRNMEQGVRIPVALDQIAPVLIEATIAAEDRRFEHHPGIDPIAMARAAIQLPWRRSGASTITQQLARRLYLQGGGGPLPIRKGREALIALRLDAQYSKDEILAAYLNDIYYGRGAYGAEAAARIYFGVSARNLDLAQASFLAGLPQLPSTYDSSQSEAFAKARQSYVLDRLAAGGKITGTQAANARAAHLNLLPEIAPAIAPHFVQYALDELQRLRPDLAGRPGLVVETTLDAGLQQESERLVRLRLDELRDRAVSNAAVVVIEPGSGRVLAMVGSADFFDDAHSGQVNLALQPRQPGSALKPFLYAAAFEHGYTAASPLLDVPTTFQTPEGPYAPQNYDRRFHGIVPLRVALASSFNVPAVRMLGELGMDSFLEIAHRVGLVTLSDVESYGPALALGGGEVRLIDLTGAYASIANGGRLAEPFAIERVRDSAGRVLYERHQASPRQVLSAEHAYLLADILSDRDARIPGFGQVTPFDLPFRAAVKTGTTTGFRDNWAVGFTPRLAVGVWVGNADGSPMSDVSGVAGAGPIWRDVLAAATGREDPGWPERPRGLLEAVVCSPTGLLPGSDCPSPVRELFVAGTAPLKTEEYFVRGYDGVLRVNPPIEAAGWARDAGLPLLDEAPSSASVRVLQPVDGAVLYLSPELPAQELVLRASVPPGTIDVEFRVDGVATPRIAAADPRYVWRLNPGRHRFDVTARIDDGSVATATSYYEVKGP